MSSAVVLVSYRARPECTELARREIASLIAAVQAVEPDCGGITLLQDAGDPTRFMLIEHWPSREIFLGPHMQQPHIQSFIQGAGAFLEGPPEISFWHPVGA
ncbi:antibiotic biosynthesis monooxygenase [Lysobacter sp. A6]|uniref:Antibiotic biosynthesis monooxygenase n=1 Tax=Noviluteimonas lactosilytica TaxID=2888523 RepID=A0ABS8JEX4_9GAMM|nr:putative quinol monooxygenase [Lysobacter lactosilyticus]MCC8362144.1 antibiotic biosynthesis monooxygenase [Lysobacter lactosilyticus]